MTTTAAAAPGSAFECPESEDAVAELFALIAGLAKVDPDDSVAQCDGGQMIAMARPITADTGIAPPPGSSVRCRESYE